ncbi:hypothetical protein AXG93_1593s1460 [Marchantia polymorpha subsp. ruderalis]|uniref:RRP15-like protein n=1 Tax=Marchantia polymorpha subsp. ruderalis TaxID=1480154 RepID=A0A176WM29_MARPO|nr:hypothetical protein AXG93_1593s1460 [Marchantia polymorpha subsp. ruderalis]
MGKRKPEDDLESEEEEDDDDVVEVSGDEDEDDDGEEDSESGDDEDDEDEDDEDDDDDDDEDDEGSDSEGEDEEENDGQADFDDGLSGSDFDDDLIQDDEFEGVSGSDISDGEAEGQEDANGAEMGEEKVEQKGGIGGAFGRAFSSIMNKKVPKSELTHSLMIYKDLKFTRKGRSTGFVSAFDSQGPVLAERKQLLVKKLEEEENERKKKTDVKKRKREEREKGHSIPQTYMDPKEKALIKLATTGGLVLLLIDCDVCVHSRAIFDTTLNGTTVVRLFNAVSKAQKVQADADISSSKSAKATWKQSKQAFMTQLRGGPKDETRPVGGPEKSAEEEEAGWSALKDDFMLGTAKMKDWDKNPEDVAV